MQNAGNVKHCSYVRDFAEFWVAYDNLPRKLRLYMDELAFPFDPIEIMQAVRAGDPEDVIIAKLRAAEARLIPQQIQLLWPNPYQHPMHGSVAQW